MEINKESSARIISIYNYFMVKFNDILKAEQESADVIKIIVIYYRVPDLKVL